MRERGGNAVSKRPVGLGGNAPGFAQGLSLAFEFVGAVVLFWLLGRWIDGRFGTEPWAQVIGAVVGWAGGFLHVYYKVKGVAWEGVPGTRAAAPQRREERPARAHDEREEKEVEVLAAEKHRAVEERDAMGGTR